MDQTKKITMQQVQTWSNPESEMIDDFVYNYLLDMGKNPKNISFNIVVTYEEWV